MSWILIITGAALLSAGALLTWLLAHRNSVTYSRIAIPRRLLPLIRQAAKIPADHQDIAALADSALVLSEQLHHLRAQLRKAPSLPDASDGEPRLMALARDAADDGQFTAEALVQALTNWQNVATPAEVSAFPLYVAVAQGERLRLVLRTLLTDANIRRRAWKLAIRLPRSKTPYALLDKAGLNSLGLATLSQALRQHEHAEALVLLDRWLEAHEITVDDLAQQDALRQVQLAGEIRRAVDCFAALTLLPWTNICEEADVLHPLLMKDPAGIYPCMTPDSRMSLRLQAEHFSRRAHMDAEEIIRYALMLCEDAEPLALEQYIGYWLQDAAGMHALHRTLGTRKGRLYARFSLQRGLQRYMLRLTLGILFGFIFLHSGHPVFMLPFFLLVTGSILRTVAQCLNNPPLPCMETINTSRPLRTLVVLPAMLHDQHQAIRMVRLLRTVSHTCPRNGVDYLLLGDFSPCMTAVSSSDSMIVQAAASAISALQEEMPLQYMQRCRTWDGSAHAYCARGGQITAASELCRLIVQGECADALAFSTIEPAALERRYDFVFVISEKHTIWPGTLHALLQKIAHPLCSRYPTCHGWRGYSMLTAGNHARFQGMALLRPDAFLEATDGMLPHMPHAGPLSGELAGIAAGEIQPDPSPSSPIDFDAQYAAAQSAWLLLPWQLPWVRTPSGVLNNQLNHAGRFRFRDLLRETLLPLGQLVLMLWAVLAQEWLLLFAVLLSEAFYASGSNHALAHCAARLSLLPVRALVSVLPLYFRLPWQRGKSPQWPALEVWAQGIAATLFASLGIAIPSFAVPSLMMAILFACFPLAYRLCSGPLRKEEGLTSDHVALLEDIATSTWQYFSAHTNDSTRFLPPRTVQFEPPSPLEAVTSPEAAGAYLLSCVCAKELGLISAHAAAERLHQSLMALKELPMPSGLPCQRYALPSLTIADPQTDAAGAGFYAAALMVTAQALRTWMPELPSRYSTLSGEASACLDKLDLTALFDPAAGLLHAAMDADQQPQGMVQRFADPGFLLLVAAAALDQVPADCLTHLRRTRIRHGRKTLSLSEHGTASAHLLAGLFLPLDDQDAAAYIDAMQARGSHALFGLDVCFIRRFDRFLRYQQEIHGVQEASASPISNAPVFAPYAAALALPFQPHIAAEALSRFCALGAKGPHGFCDAIDCTDAPMPVGAQDSFHQGLILCAVAHLLCDAPLRRYFCALPAVEAILPLMLHAPKTATLSAPPLRRMAADLPSAPKLPAVDPLLHPVPLHALGTDEFHLLADAHGGTCMFDHELPLCKEMHFYLADEGRTYWLGDPMLPGEVHFRPGEANITQVCGSLRSELAIFADTLRRRAIHVITVTNLSTRDRTIELADFLRPDMAVPSNTLEPQRPEPDHLLLRARSTELTLHHTISVSVPALRTTVCTDVGEFIGRRCSRLHPAWLDVPAEDHLTPSAEPCLSFRMRMPLGGRGKMTLWFTTSLQDTAPPLLTELPGMQQLCTMQHAAIDASAVLSAHQLHLALRLLPLLPAQEITLLTEDATIAPVRDLLAIQGWLLLHGLRTELRILCPTAVQEAIAAVLPGTLAEDLVQFAPVGAPHAALHFHSNAPLDIQLDAMYTALSPSPASVKPPVPARLPTADLLFPDVFGGFDPLSLDYVLQLEPDQLPPSPCLNRHITRHFQEVTDETGLIQPFHEQVWIQMPGGATLSPWSHELARAIRFSPGATVWEAWSEHLDLRLRASCLPGHRCGLRVLTIHNATSEALTMQITVQAHLGQPLVCAADMILTDAPEKRLQAFLTGSGWQVRRVHAEAHASITDAPCLHLPDAPDAKTAQLTCTLTLAPGRRGKVFWITGFARHGEEAVRALTHAQSAPLSDLLRQAALQWAQHLNTLTFSTPEDSLSLLMNRILPWQVLSSEDIEGLASLKHIAPDMARRLLLQHARKSLSRDGWADFILAASDYTSTTQDTGWQDVYLQRHNDTLLNVCRQAILSLPLDRHHLPLGDDQARRCFLFSLAAKALASLRPDPKAAEFSRMLLNAADTYLWQDGFYGAPLRLDVQTLACAAYGATPRTRQAITTCWTTLYERRSGLIRNQAAADLPPLPGLPENGGMITLEAVRCVQALLQTARHEEAFELLRALNPLHHTDTPERQAVFRAAPYRLHGGMCAAPMATGQATPGGDAAAALLYSVVLEDILGMRRKGNELSIEPCVPADWDDFTITLQEGASTWHISAERRVKELTVDSQPSPSKTLHLTDDGKIHHVHFPLK